MIVARKANEHDCEDVLIWRNDPITRQMSHSTEEISVALHERWFEKALANDALLLLICEAEASGNKIGIVRFDLEGEQATISINLSPQQRGKGLSIPSLEAAIAFLHQHQPQVRRILAEIKEENLASQHCFERVGFVCIEVVNRVCHYQYTISKTP